MQVEVEAIRGVVEGVEVAGVRVKVRAEVEVGLGEVGVRIPGKAGRGLLLAVRVEVPAPREVKRRNPGRKKTSPP